MKPKIYLLSTFFLLSILSCKKETYMQAQQFGTIRFSNQSGLSELKLSYNGELYSNGGLNNVFIPAGSGKFSFIDPAAKETLLDTVLTVQANSVQDFVLFRPGEDAQLILLQNNQQNEAAPGPGLMKVKIANLATKALPHEIGLVFYALDDDIYDYVPIDTLTNIPRQFDNGYVILKNTTSLNDPSLLVKIIDPETQQPLSDFFFGFENFNFNTGMLYSVFTLYIKDDNINGLPVNGTTNKVSIGSLFSN